MLHVYYSAQTKHSSVTDQNPTTITISPAHGRPLLTWVGKRPLRHVPVFPAQHIETFAPSAPLYPTDHTSPPAGAYPPGGLIFQGDNKEVLAHLLASGLRGQINLIYIDPPFDSGADYVRKLRLRGSAETTSLAGAGYSPVEQIQYSDIWSNDAYLQFMYERLLLLRELLAEDGSIYLHCDYRRSHHLRCLMDEVFGPEHLQNEIIWFYPRGGDSEKQFNRKHDTILFYTRGDTWTFNYQDVLIPYTPAQLARFDQEDEQGRFYWNVNPRGQRVKTYLRKPGIGEYDVWTIGINAAQIQQVAYPTLKPEALLERIIRASSRPNDLILDCFSGSGTTAAMAQKLGRRWVACDINRGAIQTTIKRLQSVIHTQLVQSDSPKDSVYGFTVYRVNQYDLALHPAEAKRLVCEHIGITCSSTDAFFDGTLGRRLVRLIAFTHPLLPADLEALRRELAARPGEARDIVLVCLDTTLAADAWIAEWNRLRGSGGPNRIEVIELRSDGRYGTLMLHRPATARVSIRRVNGMIHVDIHDFISPMILERLAGQPVQIDDWRSLVDYVLIDPAYDGAVFQMVYCDIPAAKHAVVQGTYELPAPPGPTNVAVKIIDMLGEEVLVIEWV